MSSAEGDPVGLFYLEIFSGSGRLSSSLLKKLASVGKSDVQVIRIDVRDNAKDDILRAECFLRIQRLVNSGKCLGVWMAPPCSTWSTSRRHDGTGAPPLRSPDHVMGLPGLSSNDYTKVKEANDMVDRSFKIAANCILNRVPFAIENREDGNMSGL